MSRSYTEGNERVRRDPTENVISIYESTPQLA